MPCTTCAASSENPPSAVAESAMPRKRSRRLMSDIAFPHFLSKIFCGAPGHRGDRERGILVRVADERRRVGDKQILHFVRLAVFVQHGSARVVAHANGSKLVNDLAA